MDEYIKKSDLKAELLRRDFYPAIVKNALETIPPADVVPRAMIAEIFEEIERVCLKHIDRYNRYLMCCKEFADLKKKYTEGQK